MNTISRRAFLCDSSMASVGLAIAFHLSFDEALAADFSAFEPNAYIRITPDNVVTLWVVRSEMGQGVRTNLPAALAEELEVDLKKIRLEQAMPGARFKGIRLRTSGSGSSSGTFMALRRAGAAAREMLIAAAAQQWGVEASSCRAENGTVVHDGTHRSLTYGQLADAAARLPVPAQPRLKAAKDFRYLGKPLKRMDAPDIVCGRAHYGFDVRVPNMLVAIMERSPYIGGKAKSFDARKALAVPGVRHVVPVSKGIFTGVAVVADNTWAALKGREALTVDWDNGPNADFDSDRFIDSLKQAPTDDGYPIRFGGDPAAALASAARKIDAVYEYPFQVHAPMEPMNCTADVREDSCELWLASQTPETAYNNAIKTLNLPPENVKVHTTLMGGGFGRRLFVDYADEAIEISRAVQSPVQLVWTRADDTRNGFFHPASIEKFVAALDPDGRLLAWQHKSVGSNLSMFGLPTAEEMKDRQRYARDESPWGAFDTPYNFAALDIQYFPVNSPVPSGAWRAVEYPSRVFGRESFLDEVAHAARRDPLQARIDLLAPGDILSVGEQRIDRARMIRVLQTIRDKSGWNTPMKQAAGRRWGRGVALNIYSGESYMAQVAEVSVGPENDIRVHRIVCVFDCGLPINPAGLEGQVESGITWGLSATLHGRIDFRNGRAEQRNYADFRVMQLNEMPAIETHIIPSDVPPGGFGEHPVAPVAPAVGNAIFAATGKRLRALPFTPRDLARL
jgi:isoquinoline 1-oxidoreductase beta subunit